MARETPVKELTLVKLIEKLSLLENISKLAPPSNYTYYEIEATTTPTDITLPAISRGVLVLNDGSSDVYVRLKQDGPWIKVIKRETLTVDFETNIISVKTIEDKAKVRIIVSW